MQKTPSQTHPKPFFKLDTVLKDGVFFTMNKLYGITFRERTDLPVYQKEVRVFDVLYVLPEGSPLSDDATDPGCGFDQPYRPRGTGAGTTG